MSGVFNMYGKRSPDFVKGVLVGLQGYAWWKDGVQYVGTCGTTLRQALEDAVNELAEVPEDFNVDEIIKKGYV